MKTSHRFPAWITRQAYWLAVGIPLLLPAGWLLRDLPGLTSAFAWLAPIALFVLLPVADHFIGRDEHNPPPNERNPLLDRLIPVAAALSYLTVLIWALGLVGTRGAEFSLIALIGWTLSLAIVGGVIAINVSHELIHRREAWLQNLGGLMLSCVYYACFKLEHPRWHHVKVATAQDPSSAGAGSNVYRKVPRALLLNTVCGWKLGAEAAQRAGRPAWLNEMVIWYGISAGITLMVYVLWGALPAAIMVIQAIGAAALLEVINYVEHYGLRRGLRPDGRYVPPGKEHSWDADFWLSNALLIQLPRHADHHVNPSRPFTALQRSPEAPQMPFGYSTAVLVALVPPLWFRVMDHRLESDAAN